MAVGLAVYRPRDAERSVLHAVVRTHLETFLRAAAHRADGARLPQFVEQPRVPVRQWVLSLPYRLRYLLAWDHHLCRAVLGVYIRVLLDFYRRLARRCGVPDGHTVSRGRLYRGGGGSR